MTSTIVPTDSATELPSKNKRFTMKWTGCSNLSKNQAHSHFQEKPNTSPVSQRPLISMSSLPNPQISPASK